MSGIPPLADLHTHFVPGVDDGARTVEEAIGYLEEFEAEGVRRVVATPHLPASRAAGPHRRRVEEAFREVRAAARESLQRLRLSLSYEIRLDDREAPLDDPGLTLGGGDALLVEFSGFRLPGPGERPLARLLRLGRIPVLAHPERFVGMAEGYGRIPAWREDGVRTCVNVGSLWGRHGPAPQRVARRMLASGEADLLATDHHARPGREDSLRRVWDFLSAAGHAEAARLLLSENPAALLEGRRVEPVPPVHLETEAWREIAPREGAAAGRR